MPDRQPPHPELCIERLRADRSSVELERRLVARLAGAGASDPDQWLELARLRDEQLHLAVGAADAYRATLERRPEDLGAIRGLRCIAERLSDWEGARTAHLDQVPRSSTIGQVEVKGNKSSIG